MKKLLVLLSMFALASGAWAVETYPYTWTIKITHIDEGFVIPTDLTAYLVDKSVPLYNPPIGYYDYANLRWAELAVKQARVLTGTTPEDGKYVFVDYGFQSPALIPDGSLYTVLSSASSPGDPVWLTTTYSPTSGMTTFGVVADFRNIPEPTSGLLLLLGVAGLALKRKKAA